MNQTTDEILLHREVQKWKDQRARGQMGAPDQVIPLHLSLQPPFFEVWQGLKAVYGLDNDFLNFMAGVMIKRTLITFMEMDSFGE